MQTSDGDAVDLSAASRYENTQTRGPSILSGFQGEKCQLCDPGCCDSGCFEKYFCCKRVVPANYSVRNGQALMVIYNNDIYSQATGPAEIKVCCHREKSFYWINTSVQTFEFENPSFYDFNQKQMAACAVITYRVVDIINYIFNLKRSYGDDQGVTMNILKMKGCCQAIKFWFIKTFCPCIWNMMEKERTIRKDIDSDDINEGKQDKAVKQVLTVQGKATIQEVFGGEDPDAVKQNSRQLLTNSLNRRIKHIGVVAYDVSMTEAGLPVAKLEKTVKGYVPLSVFDEPAATASVAAPTGAAAPTGMMGKMQGMMPAKMAAMMTPMMGKVQSMCPTKLMGIMTKLKESMFGKKQE